MFVQYYNTHTFTELMRMLVFAGSEGDYVRWLAHSSDPTGSNDGCVLGYKETFLRLRKGSVCWNGRDYGVTKKLSPCPCTLDDYHWYALVHVLLCKCNSLTLDFIPHSWYS